MAHLHNMHRKQSHSFWTSVGEKVRHAAEIAGAVKGLYDTGRMIYNAAQYIGPAVASAGVIL
jgi:hypothetical protein